MVLVLIFCFLLNGQFKDGIECGTDVGSLPEYVGQMGTLYTNLGRPLTVQEYLDRQDFYTLVFFVTGDLEQLLQLQVNSWRLRAFNHIKL